MNSTRFGNFLGQIKKCAATALLGASITSLSVMAQTPPANQQPAIKSPKVAQSLLQDVVSTGDRLVAVGERGHIIYSDDNGTSWKQADVPTRQMLNAVYFVNPEKGWAVGYDGLILNTVDGGQTWSIQLDGLRFTRQRMANKIPELETEKKRLEDTIAELEASLADEEEALEAEADEVDQAMVALEARLEEAQERFDTVDADLADARAALEETVANPLMDVWFADEQKGFVVGAFGEFLQTRDGGQTWESIAEKLHNEDRNHLNALVGRGKRMIIVGEAGLLMRSDDSGETWVRLESPDPEFGSFFAIVMLNENEFVLAGLRGAIYRSVDAGRSWKQVPEEMEKNINAILNIDGETMLLVGNDGALLRSRDGGRTLSPHLQHNRLTIASVAQAVNGNYVLVGIGGVQVLQPGNL